ncbi:MAG: hypothetical protein ACI9G1_003884 [Pirellulaceae bacterium]
MALPHKFLIFVSEVGDGHGEPLASGAFDHHFAAAALPAEQQTNPLPFFR